MIIKIVLDVSGIGATSYINKLNEYMFHMGLEVLYKLCCKTSLEIKVSKITVSILRFAKGLFE